MAGDRLHTGSSRRNRLAPSVGACGCLTTGKTLEEVRMKPKSEWGPADYICIVFAYVGIVFLAMLLLSQFFP
jgi:hypothetical protein